MKLSTIEASLEGKWYLLNGEPVKVSEIGTDPAFYIERPTPKDLRRLNARAQKQMFTGRRKAKKDDVEVLQNLLLHHCVKDWRNLEVDIENSGEQPEGEQPAEAEEDYPCNRENREYLDGMWKEFSDMWVSVATENQSIEEAMEAEEGGN